MENLSKQIAPTFESMVRVIRSFTDSGFNAVPFENSWTAGQVARHVQLSICGMPELFKGETQPSDREPDEKVSMVADVFLDFGKKYESPESILPEQKDYERDRFLSFFTSYADEIASLSNELDMSQICQDYEIPGFGPMTRLEFLSFVLFHTQRHVLQMENIRSKIN